MRASRSMRANQTFLRRIIDDLAQRVAQKSIGGAPPVISGWHMYGGYISPSLSETRVRRIICNRESRRGVLARESSAIHLLRTRRDALSIARLRTGDGVHALVLRLESPCVTGGKRPQLSRVTRGRGPRFRASASSRSATTSRGFRSFAPPGRAGCRDLRISRVRRGKSSRDVGLMIFLAPAI